MKLSLKKKTLAMIFLSLSLIIFLGALRYYAFWFPHWKGDQSHYVSLAMKLDKQGLAGYSLREVLIGLQRPLEDPNNQFILIQPTKPGEEGDLIRVLRLFGQGYYNEPLHVRAPLFSYFLMYSHRLFAAKAPYYAVLEANPGLSVLKHRPFFVFERQFWVTIVPWLFNMGLIGLTFFLGARYFGFRAGFFGAFLLGTNATCFMLAYRLLSEDAAAFFALASLALYYEGYRRKNLLLMFAGGSSMGLSILTKQTLGIGLVVVFLFTALDIMKSGSGRRPLMQIIFNRDVAVYIAGIILSSFWWFAMVVKTYGSLFHQPTMGNAVFSDRTGWFMALQLRPHPGFFFSLGLLYLCPLFSFCFVSLNPFWSDFKERFAVFCQRMRVQDYREYIKGPGFIFWLWIFVFFLLVSQPWRPLTLARNQEHRYFYMVYPMVAMLAGDGMSRFRKFLTWRFPKRKVIVDLVLGAALLVNAAWSLSFTVKILIENNLLL